MCLAGKLDMGGIIGGLMGGYFYIVFAILTFGVLMMMDVMECFLHALRLHWYILLYIIKGLNFKISFIKQMDICSLDFHI